MTNLNETGSVTVTVWGWQCPFCKRKKRTAGTGDEPPAAFTKAISRHACRSFRLLRLCAEAGLSMRDVLALLEERRDEPDSD